MEWDKIHPILKEVKNQERERKGIQKLLENHNREIDEVERRINEFGVNLEALSEALRGLIVDFKQMEQT
jgi:septal ring factor EnvC (AmiA/AmiB activator)